MASPNSSLEWPWDPRKALRLIVLKSREVVWITLVFTALGFLYALFWPRTYAATAILKPSLPSHPPRELVQSGLQVSYPGEGDPMGTFTTIAQSDNVAEIVAQNLAVVHRPEFKGLSPQDILRKLHKMVTVSRLPASTLFLILGKAGSATFAADLTNTWAQAFMQVNLELSHQSAANKNKFLQEQSEEYYKRIQNPDRLLNAQSKSDDVMYRVIVDEMDQTGMVQNVDDAGMVVMTKAEVPEKPVWPKKTLTVLVTFFLGLAFGIQWILISDRLKPRIRDEESLALASGLSRLSSVPDSRAGREKGISDFNKPPNASSLLTNAAVLATPYAEGIRFLQASLALIPGGFPASLGVFSVHPKEGRTLTAANLALELSRSGRRVLLVDTDLRNPAVGKLFNATTPEGGITRLFGGARLSDLIVGSGHPNLWLLPNSNSPAGSASLFQPGPLESALRDLKKDYDHVIFDSSPLLSSTDALTLATRLDGALVLAHWDATPSRDLARVLNRLRSAGAPLLGAVLNGVNPHKGLPAWVDIRWGKWLWEA